MPNEVFREGCFTIVLLCLLAQHLVNYSTLSLTLDKGSRDTTGKRQKE